jgi:hypothetical protein
MMVKATLRRLIPPAGWLAVGTIIGLSLGILRIEFGASRPAEPQIQVIEFTTPIPTADELRSLGMRELGRLVVARGGLFAVTQEASGVRVWILNDAVVTFGNLPLSAAEQPKLGPGVLFLPVSAGDLSLIVVVRGEEGTWFALGDYDSAAAYSLTRVALAGATSVPYTPRVVVLDISALDRSGHQYAVSMSIEGLLFVQSGLSD